VSPAFLKKVKIPQKIKQNPYNFYIFDNQSILANKKRIDKKIGLIPVTIGIYQEILNLDMIKTSIYDIIFGLS
jgi:hypothetical protein